jgi:hypothetical protein
MPQGIGAAGIVGLAFESTPGTYVAPTKFFPIASETLTFKQTTNWRRVIRGVAAPIGAVPGDATVDGDLVIEALHDVVPYFLYAGRTSVVKTLTGPFQYAVLGTSAALTTSGRTLSLTIVRNGIVFAYTNCSVTKQVYSLTNGMLMATYSIIASDENTQSLPTASYGTTVPFGAGQYNVQIPTTTQVFDCDAMTLTIDDAGANQYRMNNTKRGPQFASFGDRTTDLQVTRDFVSKTDYAAFKALTSQGITIIATDGTNSITFLLPGSITDTYEVAMSGTGELIRATTKYMGVHDPSTTSDYKITVVTSESIS